MTDLTAEQRAALKAKAEATLSAGESREGESECRCEDCEMAAAMLSLLAEVERLLDAVGMETDRANRAERALVRYGDHDAFCRAAFHLPPDVREGDGRCNCGFDGWCEACVECVPVLQEGRPA